MSLHTGIEPSQEIDVSQLNIPTKKYVDDQDNLKLSKSGGTLTGGLSMDDNKITDLGTPTANTHASTKKYVDDQAALKLDLSGGSMTGPLGLGNGRLWDVGTPTLDTNGANKKYVDDKHALSLLKSGGTMTGEINMGDDKITNLATPTNNTDASTKKYVDDKIAAVPKVSHYFVFEFKSTSNQSWRQAEYLTGHMFWTNNRDIKLTILSHVFDDDNTLPSKFSLSYWIFYWTKTGVEKNDYSISRVNSSKHAVSGTALQSYPINRSISFNDITALTIKYRYLHSGSVGNESALHCLIEYI